MTSPRVRAGVVEAVCKSRHPHAHLVLGVVVMLAGEQIDHTERLAAVEGLRELGCCRAERILALSLSRALGRRPPVPGSERAQLVEALLTAIAEMEPGRPQTIHLLIELLCRRRDSRIRILAARALGRMELPSEFYGDAPERAQRYIRGQQVKPALDAMMRVLRRRGCTEVRVAVAQALGEMNDTRAVILLEKVAASEQEEPQVRDAASAALRSLAAHAAPIPACTPNSC